jgi:hypothetical protein
MMVDRLYRVFIIFGSVLLIAFAAMFLWQELPYALRGTTTWATVTDLRMVRWSIDDGGRVNITNRIKYQFTDADGETHRGEDTLQEVVVPVYDEILVQYAEGNPARNRIAPSRVNLSKWLTLSVAGVIGLVLVLVVVTWTRRRKQRIATEPAAGG